jgi:Protein phosphatase 2C
MNTDFYLERDREHAVCEDFATAGMVGRQGFALVSDGCSSSKEADFGSRILVHAARDNLTPLLASGASFDAVGFGEATIAKAGKALGCFAGLPVSVLDATLLLGLVRPDNSVGGFSANVYFWGDGVAVVQKHERVIATLLRFPRNAPFYLSYALNVARQQAYLDQHGGRKEVVRVTFDLAGKELSRENRRATGSNPLAPCHEQFDLEAGDSLALVSDGITQFFAADNTPIPWETLTPKFVDFKRAKGVFVRRRMNFFEKENHAAGVRHLDDLSVAAITLLS